MAICHFTLTLTLSPDPRHNQLTSVSRSKWPVRFVIDEHIWNVFWPQAIECLKDDKEDCKLHSELYWNAKSWGLVWYVLFFWILLKFWQQHLELIAAAWFTFLGGQWRGHCNSQAWMIQMHAWGSLKSCLETKSLIFTIFLRCQKAVLVVAFIWSQKLRSLPR